MRISFSVPLKPLSGKHKFAMRLAAAMKSKGIKITDKKPHVNLVFLKGPNPKANRNIFRLDGVLMNTRVNYRKKNKKLTKTIKQCDSIIYQNKFCKKASDRFLGKFKKHAIISNGAALPEENIESYKHSKPYVLTLCRWRPHKRLKATVNGFINSELIKEYDLLVLGEEPDYVIKHPSVVYMGKKTGNTLWSIIKGCEFAVHLAYIDWCPNSVVESIVCGKNVLHTSSGGTKYVVKGNGIKISDKKWDFTPIDLYDPPELDIDELRCGYENMLNLDTPDTHYLHIDYVADQYIKYCRKVLSD